VNRKRIIHAPNAPEAKGPYSPAVAFGDLLFVSGQGPVDPETGEIVHGSLEEQVRLAFDNVRRILEDAGSSMQNILKVTLYLADMDDFARANAVYAEVFREGDYPARTTIQAGRLPFDILCEVDVIACVAGD